MFQKISGRGRKLWIREGGVTFFGRFFCLTMPKNSLGNSSVFQRIPRIETFYAEETILRFSVESFLSHSTKKIHRGTPLCFRKFLLSKTFIDKMGVGGSVTFFRRTFVASQYGKTS